MPQEKYEAVIFDLLTALVNSWSLWNDVAGDDNLGWDWRKQYLQLTYQAGVYRPYEGIIREAALDVGLAPQIAGALIGRWSELQPWPETREVLRTLQKKAPLAVATNCSRTLAATAVSVLDVRISHVVTAEDAGYYKPHPSAYQIALNQLRRAPASVLFVAGSASDVPGASGVGMPVFWHNRRRLPLHDTQVQPEYSSESLWPILELV